eukprot:Blabericola_migrator_1__596@NODE_1146_length_5289_cov_106_175412_g780_i0_p5_GENE_NODE_1146_length_5289_cov_106_175412_g780_i0NODE_1146_length_5289_cov_106_175412_g780_i0_p5_ORF_typecomplete_len173_score19_47_NODE_1146_length_5289_cov_106_175412_g780_i018892407
MSRYFETHNEEPLMSDAKDTEVECYSDVGYYSQPIVPKKAQRMAKKRADIQASARSKLDRITPTGEVWACCCASEIDLSHLQNIARRRILSSSKLELRFEAFFSDVFFAWVDLGPVGNERELGSEPEERRIPQRSIVFIFKFGIEVRILLMLIFSQAVWWRGTCLKSFKRIY